MVPESIAKMLTPELRVELAAKVHAVDAWCQASIEAGQLPSSQQLSSKEEEGNPVAMAEVAVEQQPVAGEEEVPTAKEEAIVVDATLSSGFTML